MAILSGVAYKEPKDANKTFEKYGYNNHRFIDKDGAQCYIIWNDINAIMDAAKRATRTSMIVKPLLILSDNFYFYFFITINKNNLNFSSYSK